ncbi:hypothetical protein [Paenibacillus sp. FSL K6-1230]|uniref:hypothetical protein n=1 Tax=Paenibacillus sp. FSL K6-1230 TaxID=2921603 RepID=UPI0030FB4CC1
MKKKTGRVYKKSRLRSGRKTLGRASRAKLKLQKKRRGLLVKGRKHVTKRGKKGLYRSRRKLRAAAGFAPQQNIFVPTQEPAPAPQQVEVVPAPVSQSFDEAYHEGFNEGFAKGYAEGHELAFKPQG